jgi:LPXTG-site transpeptidase (sortase) family protein
MARKKRRKLDPRNNNRLYYAIIALGLLLFLLGTFTQTQVYSRLLFNVREKPRLEYSPQAPVSISIPSAEIDARIIEGGIVHGNWILSDFAALYLPTSGKVGEGYNTIIYAHNSEELFGSLEKVKLGDVIVLANAAGRQFVYRITSRENIEPWDLKKLYSEEKNVITLFTCDGWFDSERLLVRAKLVD